MRLRGCWQYAQAAELRLVVDRGAGRTAQSQLHMAWGRRQCKECRWVEVGEYRPLQPGNLRNKKRREWVGHKLNRELCHSCGSSRQRPHPDGRHTSSNSPLDEKRQIGSEHLQISFDAISAILLLRGRGISAIGLAGIALRSRLCPVAILRRNLLIILAETRLNFVNHAEITDELGTARIYKVNLAVGVAINTCRFQIRKAWFTPRKTSTGNQDQEGGHHRSETITNAGIRERAQPGKGGAPAGDRFTWPKSFIQDGVDEPGRGLDFIHGMKIVEQMRNAGKQRLALRASGNMGVKCASLFRLQQSFEIVGEPCFGFFVCPVRQRTHDGPTPICCKMRASSMRPRLMRDFTVPSGTAKVRCISPYSSCWRSRKITASRSSGESLVRAT